MARPKLADEIQKVKNLATDPAKTPRARIVAARRLVRDYGFSTRNLRVAKKIAKLFLADMEISIDDRKKAQSLLEYLHDQPKRDEDGEDDHDENIEGEAIPGTVEPVTPKGPPHASPGFTTFEQLLPHIRGLDQLNLDDPSALEFGNATYDKRQALCLSIGLQVQECRRMLNSDDRGCPPNAEIIQGIISWANKRLEPPLDSAKPQAVLIGRWGLRLTQNSPRFNSLYQDLFCDEDAKYYGEQASEVVPSVPSTEIPVPDPVGPAEFRPDLSVPPGTVVPNSEF